VGLATLTLAVTAAMAIAQTFNGDGTFIGTSGNDTFNLGNGNDKAYGLLGADTINAGNGNNVLDGDASCMQGNNNSQYCQDGPQQGDQGDTINAGNGNDIIFGGGGNNIINFGQGTDTIYGGLKSDTMNATGPKGTDTIYLQKLGTDTWTVGGSTVNLGSSAIGVIYAQNGKVDTINCNGSKITIYADHVDHLNRCRGAVIYTAPPAADTVGLARAKGNRSKTRHRRHHARAHRKSHTIR
jgi:Ca2+-binding RTX toxin-like protein